MSSIKSPRLESPSSPIGVSSESGSLAIFKVLRTFSSGMWSFSASCRAHPLMTGFVLVSRNTILLERSPPPSPCLKAAIAS